jgi:hypothetical protein
MNALAKVASQSTFQGKCQGFVNGTEAFDAGLVELLDAIYPPPHGEAHVMLATQRAPAPDYTTKELKISFSKDKPDGTYGLFAEAYTVRVLYVDNSLPTKPVVYTQYQGQARVAYDTQSHIFSGEISVTLENRDEDTRKTVDVKVKFEAYQHVTVRRIPRRPTAKAARC